MFFAPGQLPLVTTARAHLHYSVRNKGFSNQEFIGRVRECLPEENGIYETDASGNCLEPVRLSGLEENTFYLFDSDAALAFSHAVEDLALEDASGNLLAAMQNFAQFESNRERYGQLSATLEKVEVIACGKMPRRNGRMKFCRDANGLVKKFWMTLYEGKKSQAMFLGEQSNAAEVFDDKMFTGFYTFNPRIVAQTRDDMAESLAGRCPELRQFAQLHRIDRAAKHLKIEFAREKAAMDIAMGKLQGHGKKYQGKHFLSDLNKTLERLNRLQTHLPELVVEQQKK